MESEELATQGETTSTELQEGTRKHGDSENLPSAEDAAAAASSVVRATNRGDIEDVFKEVILLLKVKEKKGGGDGE